MTKNKVLITGGAGFIGSHIVEKLLENNYNVIIIDNLSSGSIENIPNSDTLKFYQLNIEKDDLELVFQKETPDYVIHLAAQTSVNFSISHPYYDANMNVMASIKLLELCKKYNIRKFITASSAAIYGNPKYLPIDENHPTEPMSQYGLSKLTMEKYIKLSGIPYIIFRFSNAYGPRQKSSKESGVVAIFNNAMKNNEPINIYGDGEQIRDFIYVEDIANICIKAINSNVENEIINFSTNKGVSLNQLFKVMKSLYNYTLNANYLPERIGDIKNSILSNDKAYNLLKFTNYTKLEKGLEILANYID
jgi:UDP-glucose 4-epimerase